MAPRRQSDHKKPEEESGGGAVALRPGSDLATGDFGSEFEDLGDLGFSTRAEDSLIPILSILQDNSGEVKKKHDRYLEGAEAGMLIVRSLKQVYGADGPSEGIVFQPAGFTHLWVEWQGEVGEGVPVAQYPFDDMPSDAEEGEDPNNPERKVWTRPNGNRLVDTRYHYGNMIAGCEIVSVPNVGQVIVGGKITQLVIPFAGTNHTISRQWTSLMRSFEIPKRPGQTAPSWLRGYRIRTQFQQRGAQSWYKYLIDDLGWVGEKAHREAGKKLVDSVSSGKVSADIESEAVGGSVGKPGAGADRTGDGEVPI